MTATAHPLTRPPLLRLFTRLLALIVIGGVFAIPAPVHRTAASPAPTLAAQRSVVSPPPAVTPQMTGMTAAWRPGELTARSGHAMAYDAARQRVVLFGGRNGSTTMASNDTWEWDGATWIQRTSAISPSARFYYAMAYDVARQRIVLFGGGDSISGFFADTWEWDGTTWLQRTPPTVPSARSGTAMAYDVARQRIVLFGGYGNGYLNDTWEWDGTTWLQRTPPTAPSARSYHAMVYDAARQRIVLFGGSQNNALNDTWEWDGSIWTQHTPPTAPSVRSSPSLVYDAVRQRIVLFGGSNGSTLNDTWEWDGTIWTQSTSPTPTQYSFGAMAYDAIRQRVVLFNGVTWEYDGTIWSQRLPSQAAEYIQATHGMLVYDSARQRSVLFNGRTWEWDGAIWTQRTTYTSTSPFADPNAYSAMAYDAAHQRVILFGGKISYGGSSFSNETWAWDGTNWTKLSPVTSPTARANHIMAYDAARQRVVLFGGYNLSGFLSETWEWDGTTWTQRTPATSPSGGGAMAYDAARQRVVLFTTIGAWEWDGTTWTQRIPATSLPARGNYAMAYDTVRQRVVLFGGDNGTNSLNDTWEWDGTTWTQRTLTISPPAQTNHTMTYDPVRQRIILSGVGGTWEYDGTRWRLAMGGNFTQPGTRTSPALVYETNGTTLLFGGRNGATLNNDTFRWDGAGWKQVTPLNLPPAARSGAHLARNGDGSRLLLFGGIDASSAYLDDTWVWESANDDWLVQAPATKPSARALYGLTFDQARSVWVLFGGQGSGGYLGDTWEYNGTNWTQRTPATSPSARSNATLTYDPVRGQAVLIGGQGDTGYRDDVWAWNGTNWVEVTPAQRLSARTGHSAAYDSTRSVIVVAGGSGNGGVLGDTWEWNGADWRQRTTALSLPAMYHQGMDYDATHDRMVLFGGENSTGAVAGVYLHQVTGPPSTAPSVQVSPTSLSFSAAAGGANPAAQTLSITNGGDGTLTWTASENLSWLSLNATSGTAPASLGVTVDSTGMAAGLYTGNLTLSDSGASGSSQTVAVTLTVTTSTTPVLQTTPTSLSFSAVVGGATPAAQAVSIANGSGGTLTWTASASVAWLSLDATSGTAPATINATASSVGLSVGSYSGSITLSASGASGSPQTISVLLVVRPAASGSPTYEPNDTCAQAGAITPDGSVQRHTFATPGDIDWVAFPASAGSTYLVEAQIPVTSTADVVLELYAQCDSAATTNQDYTFAPGVRLEFTAPASGILFLKLLNHTPASAGPTLAYDLSVRALAAQEPVGALILVAGRLLNVDRLQPNIHAVTNAVATRFKAHGYTDDRITYLATDLQLPGVDGLATQANLRAAITQWALDKVGPSQALTLYLIDHGSDKHGFYLDEPHNERLSPAQLAGWIAELEAARPGVRVNIIIEACYSGTFIPALSKTGRVVITSTGSDQAAYASPQGAFFSDPFVAALGSGSSLYLAFQQGRSAVLAAQYAQSPALDDNGNGQANDSGDGAEAQRRGFAFAGTFGSGPGDDASWPPYISEVQVTLDPVSQGAGLAATGRGQIRARVQDNQGVHSVWAVIYEPGYQPPAPSEGMIKETLPTVQLLDQGDGWYAAIYPGFTAFGGYRVAVFADDHAAQLARPASVELQTGFRVFVPLLAR